MKRFGLWVLVRRIGSLHLKHGRAKRELGWPLAGAKRNHANWFLSSF